MQNASISYELPIIETRSGTKYAVVDLRFTVVETNAYDAKYIAEHGSFRGLSSSLERRINSMSGRTQAISLSDIQAVQGGAGPRIFNTTQMVM